MSVMLAIALATSPLAVSVPNTETSCDALSPEGLEHHETLRIDRDFGKPEFDLVVDAWTKTASPGELADVRLWWLKTTAADQRSPMSTRSQKYVDIETIENEPDAWTLQLRGDHKEFRFDVEVDAGGRAQVFTDIVTAQGKTIRHCRATAGKLRARRLLGIPIGIDSLAVECVDDRGRAQRGKAVVRKLRR
jgi:hypothetical protein